MPTNDVDDSKVVEDVYVPPKNVSIIRNITVGFGTPIFYEAYVSSDSTSNDVNKIVESNILALPSKSIEFLCAEYSFMVILLSHILVSHLSSLS